MKPIIIVPLLAIHFLAALPLLRADVSVASIFSDHAVLQRGKPIPVWGNAAPGEEVTVSYRNAKITTNARADGTWRTELPPQQEGEAADLVVTGVNRIALRDVVVGEVWFCSGQSNMAFTLDRADNASAEIRAADLPQIRQFRTTYAAEGSPVNKVGGTWQTSSPETVGKFTAVGYFFAREIHQALGVPIGIINSSVGGTPVEAWMPADTYAALLQSADGKLRVEGTPKGVSKVPQKRLPSVLYNGMVAPLVPYGLRGFLWYQGEANANEKNPQSAANYAHNFQALITSWRQQFDQGDLPFYFVQLPNFKTANPASGLWPIVRNAQNQALSLPATGMAVTIDVGNPDNIHPTNKQVVGHRLALIALKQVYQKPVGATGPVLIRHEVRGNRIQLDFDQAVVLKPGASGSFEIAEMDGKFVPANVNSEKSTVFLSNGSIAKPVFARYAWSNNPSASLFNGIGLPAAPFQVKLSNGAEEAGKAARPSGVANPAP